MRKMPPPNEKLKKNGSSKPIPLASSFPLEDNMTPRSKRRADMRKKLRERKAEREKRQIALVGKRKENLRSAANKATKRAKVKAPLANAAVASKGHGVTNNRGTGPARRTTSGNRTTLTGRKTAATCSSRFRGRTTPKEIDEIKEHNRQLKTEAEELQKSLKESRLLNTDLKSQIDIRNEKIEELHEELRNSESKLSSALLERELDRESFRLKEKEFTEQLEQLNVKVMELEKRCALDEQIRRELHNTIAELKGNIRVFCRVRPHKTELDGKSRDTPFHFPEEDPESKQLSILQEGKQTLDGSQTTVKTYNFAFDRAFRPFSSNLDVNKEVSQLVQSALDGYNVSLFCYGQTGSGKTYTMEGTQSDPGIIPYSVQQIFNTANKQKLRGWQFNITASFLEIYREGIFDLLRETQACQPLELKQSKESDELIIPNLTLKNVSDKEEVIPLLQKAQDLRKVAATACNDRSSRSHSVFRLEICSFHNQSGVKRKGTLNLVDLAGSERLSRSKVEGKSLEETKSINKSLSCLGDVIFALASGQKFIPYRNSKLTYLLQNSLGGNSKTLVIVNLSPTVEATAESLQTLRFGHKVNSCEIGTAKRNTNPKTSRGSMIPKQRLSIKEANSKTDE